MNVLVLAADFTTDKEARDMLYIFLEAKFGGEKRHQRRIEDIKEIEEKN
jgi:ribose 5-phosphate isomerase RpiB